MKFVVGCSFIICADLAGSPCAHRWPDPTYFTRLAAECANKGVTLQPATAAAVSASSAMEDANENTAEAQQKVNSAGAAAAVTPLSVADAAVLAQLASEAAAKSAEISAAMRAGDQSKVKELMKQRKALLDQKNKIEGGAT